MAARAEDVMALGCARKGMELKSWKHSATNFALRVEDVRSLRKGDVVDLLVLDRSMMDVVTKRAREKIPTPPISFFKGCIAKYMHVSGVTGKIRWPGETVWRTFRFEIEYKEGEWYPLSQDGCLPAYDTQIHSLFGEYRYFFEDKRERCLSSFPRGTHLGWRGPMIPVQRLSLMPKRMHWVWYDSDWIPASCLEWQESMREARSKQVPVLSEK